MLKGKCDILNKGFAKWQKAEEAKFYLHLKEKYENWSDDYLLIDPFSNRFVKSAIDCNNDDRSG